MSVQQKNEWVNIRLSGLYCKTNKNGEDLLSVKSHKAFFEALAKIQGKEGFLQVRVNHYKRSSVETDPDYTLDFVIPPPKNSQPPQQRNWNDRNENQEDVPY